MVRGQDISHSPKIRLGGAGFVVPLVAGVLVAAYCLALRRYGLELADEGVLLAQFERVAHGQVPYRDFHVGYGPAAFWLHALTFAWFGASIATVRIGLALVHAARAAVLARLGTAAAGPGWGLALGLALVAFFLPVAPGVCVPGNIPYPAWFADALGLTALLLIASPRAPMITIGCLWGLVFAFKQNSGVLGAGAAVVTTVLAGTEAGGGSRGLGALVGAGLVGAALVLLREHLDPTLALVFVVPIVPLAVALSRTAIDRATLGALARLGLGFVAVAGTIVAVTTLRAGAAPVRTDFLQIGTDTIRTYHAPYPTLGGLLHQLEGAPLARAVRLIAEAAWFVVLPALHLGAASLVAGGRIRSRLGIALVSAAAVGYLQLYPRMDFWHLLPLAPASLATIALVAATLGGLGGRVVLAALVGAAAGRLAPTIPVLAAATTAPHGTPVVARLDLSWELLHDERLTRLPELIGALQGRRRVAGFPALGIVNFALGEPSPWRHDYFFPGRPGAGEEGALAATIARDPPEAVVVLDDPGGSFAPAFAAHAVVLEAIERRLVEVRRIGPYRILEPRSGP